MGIVERIRTLAAEKGETIASIERLCSFGQGSIRKWDHAAPSADKLYKVAQIFNVSMEYLLIGGLRATLQEDQHEKEFEGIGVDGLRAGLLWEQLDEPGRAIILGEMYKRLESRSKETDAETNSDHRAGRVG